MVNRKKLQNKKLREASKEAFDKKKIESKDIKSFLSTFNKLKSQGKLSEEDKKAAMQITKTIKKKMKQGKIK